MKTKHITEALELLSASQLYLGDIYDKMPGLLDEHKEILTNAQAELAELQRLVSVVQGFIKENKVRSEDSLLSLKYGRETATFNLAIDLCDIVGYKE